MGSHYLYPVTMNGPTNQIYGLLEVFTLASLLNVTAILPRLINHSTKEKGEPGTFAYYDLYDFSDIAKHVDFVRLPHFVKSEQWFGEFDHLICFGRICHKHDNNILQFSKHRIHNKVQLDYQSGQWNFDNAKKLFLNECSREELQAFKENHLENYHIIAAITYKTTFSLREMNPCSERFTLLASLLRPHPRYAKLAEDFINEKIGNEPYMAAQIRPKPDDCSQAWARPTINIELLTKICLDPWLWDSHVPTIVDNAKRLGIKHVFVMAHPKIVDLIIREFESLDVKIHNFPMERLLEAIPGASVYQLAIIEQTICMQSDFFIGTASSSIAQFIEFARLGSSGNKRATEFKPLNSTAEKQMVENLLIFDDKDATLATA